MFSIFRKRETAEQAYSRGKQEGYQLRSDEQNITFQKTQDYEQSRFLGVPMIAISNEWDNPVIGFGKRMELFGKSYILVIQDYVTNEEKICNGVHLPYNAQRLETILSLDPNQLIGLLYGSYGHQESHKRESDDFWRRDKIIAALDKNDFWTKANNYLDDHRKDKVTE